MLKWIQDEYDAEVVALTVNLGQPGEDYDVVQGKALQLGAVAAEVVDAREEFAHDFLVPAIKANAIYGLNYPLFTALGRPLIAKLAVEYALKHGCDTSPTAARARATTRSASRRRWPRSRPS
jgi:argininosuccinate synthase